MNSTILASGTLNQSAHRVYIGDECQSCPDGTRSLKILIRSCVPFSFALKKGQANRIIESDNADDFEDDFEYGANVTCQALDLDVRTYWKEICLRISDIEKNCFSFKLGSHPTFKLTESFSLVEEHRLGTRNTEFAIFWDDEEVQVDFALLGISSGRPFSEIEGFLGGGCDSTD